MKNVVVIFCSPDNVFGDIMAAAELTDQQIMDSCFRVRKYNSVESALDAYAETPCTWSKLMDEDADIQAFIKEALQHIKDNDVDWLEENFT